MGSIKGGISVMPLSDLPERVKLSSKTGKILSERPGAEKNKYVEGGKIIFVSSAGKGDRPGEYLQSSLHLEAEKKQMVFLYNR